MNHADMPAVVYEFGDYRLEPTRRALTRADGTVVLLRSKPFDTLVYLVAHAGELIDRDELLDAVWPRRVVEDNNLNQAVATLRRVLGEGHVVTVAGRGYQFVSPVREVVGTALSAAGPEHDSATPPASVAAHVAPQPTLAAPRRRSPVFIAAAAGVALVGLFAFAPWGSSPSSRMGARVTVQPLTGYPGEEITPAFSPDGTRVAFSWSGPDGRRSLYVTQVGADAPVALTDGGLGKDANPAWSPNGERIAFLRWYEPSRFDVMVIHSIGGVARKLHGGWAWPISVEGSPLLTWTPDGRELLFTTLRAGQSAGESYGLHRLVTATGEVADLGLVNETLHYDTSPAVSADGAWLAFTRYTRTGRLNQVMVQRLGPGLAPLGKPQPAPGVEPSIYHSLHWSPTGDRLWFASSSEIFEWPIGSSPRVAYTLGPRFSTAMLAIVRRVADVRVAAVVRRTDQDIFALPLDPGTHEAVGTARVRVPSSGIEYHPRVSPDGRSLAFVSDRSGAREIWITDIDEDRPRQLTDVRQLIVGYPRWSPDSKAIAFHSSAPNEDRVIHRVDVESGTTKRLFNGCCPGDWSADGNSLYVTELGAVNYVQRVDVLTGQRLRLFEGETAHLSADGQTLLFSKSRERGYFRRPADGASGGGAEELLVSDYRPSVGGIAPVADGFFYVGLSENETPRAIRFFDYARGEPRDIAEVPASTSIGLAVSQDGRTIFYAAVGGPPESDILLLEFAHARDD